MDLWKYYDGDLKYINLSSYIYSNEALNDKESRKEILKTRPEWAYKQAEALHDKFPEGEPAIATNAKSSYWYAYSVLHGPFLLGEKAIANDIEYSFCYALNIIKRKFELGEPAIAEDKLYSRLYTRFILKRDFYLNNKLICEL